MQSAHPPCWMTKGVVEGPAASACTEKPPMAMSNGEEAINMPLRGRTPARWAPTEFECKAPFDLV